MHLSTKTFSLADQERFARVSGDVNPMHMDAVAARRTQVGAPVVHGVHTLLWSLEQISRQHDLASLTGLKVQFPKPVYVGDEVEVRITQEAPAQLKGQVCVDGVPVVTLNLARGGARKVGGGLTGRPEPMPLQPVALAFSDMAGRGGAVGFAPHWREIAEDFPGLCAAIGVERVAALACLSSVVGMVCPGLHSILSGLKLELADGPAGEAAVSYLASDVDDRFRTVGLSVEGAGLTGSVESYARMPPTAQPGMAEIARLVAPGVYAGALALVVGGSRGLGEVAAKAAAAGGARVIVTYAVGQGEAERVATEIRDWGGVCDVIKLDVRDPIEAQLALLPAPPSHAYYFATGPIFARRTRLFDRKVLDEFMLFYAQAFYDLCSVLSARRPEGVRVYYPSSVALDERPRDMTEYAMAKAAGETLCADIEQFMAGVSIVVTRLPRILTDQTATVRSVASQSALDVIVPIVDTVQRPG